MAALLALVASLALTGPAGAAGTELRITVWPRGPDAGDARIRTLRCPAGGTLHDPRAACRRLASMERPFAPVPKDEACSQIYGGPQVARVTGTLAGRRVWATFRRNDGCEIGRWNRVGFLFR